jgi:phosphoglycerate dehydrogenase-like enzyme
LTCSTTDDSLCRKLHAEGTAVERIEKDKAMFGGQEIAGKTLGVVGLGHIGSKVVRCADVCIYVWVSVCEVR